MSAEECGSHLRDWSDLTADCRAAVENLFEFLDHELPEADEDQIRRHIADCEPCLAEYDVEDHLRQLVRRSCSDTAPEALHVRIRTHIAVLRARME